MGCTNCLNSVRIWPPQPKSYFESRASGPQIGSLFYLDLRCHRYVFVIMITFAPSCPHCDAGLKRGQILVAVIFSCPFCQTQLQASNRYVRWIGLVNTFLSLAAAVALGFRGLRLIYAFVAFFIVIEFLAINTLKYVMSPKIQIAIPQTPFREQIRQIYGRTELKLTDKKHQDPARIWTRNTSPAGTKATSPFRSPTKFHSSAAPPIGAYLTHPDCCKSSLTFVSMTRRSTSSTSAPTKANTKA
jgi:hypothetical protein